MGAYEDVPTATTIAPTNTIYSSARSATVSGLRACGIPASQKNVPMDKGAQSFGALLREMQPAFGAYRAVVAVPSGRKAAHTRVDHLLLRPITTFLVASPR